VLVRGGGEGLWMYQTNLISSNLCGGVDPVCRARSLTNCKPTHTKLSTKWYKDKAVDVTTKSMVPAHIQPCRHDTTLI